MTSWSSECGWKSAPISLEQPPENTHPHDPHGLLGGSGILGTLALTETSVPSLPACFVVLANAGPSIMLMIIESDIFCDGRESYQVDLEWTATGFLMTRPSLMSLRMFWRELALAISLISLGSNQT